MLPPSLLASTNGQMIRVNSCQQLLQEEDQLSDSEPSPPMDNLLASASATEVMSSPAAAMITSLSDSNINTRRGSASSAKSNGRSRSDLYESIFLPMNSNPPYSRACSNNSSSSNGDLTPTDDCGAGWNALHLMEDQEGHTPSHHRVSSMKKISSAPISNSPNTIELFVVKPPPQIVPTSRSIGSGAAATNGNSLGSTPNLYPGGARPRNINSNININKKNFVQPVFSLEASPQRENWVEFDDVPLVPPLQITNEPNPSPNLFNATSTFEEKFATPRLADLESSRILPKDSSTLSKSGLSSSSSPSLAVLQQSGAKPKVNPNQITSRTDIPFQKNGKISDISRSSSRKKDRNVVEPTTSSISSNNNGSSKKLTVVNLIDEFPPFTTTTSTIANSVPQNSSSSVGVTTSATPRPVVTTSRSVATTTTTSNHPDATTVTTVTGSTRMRSSTTSTPSSSSAPKLSKASSSTSISSTGDSSTSQRSREGRRSMRSKRSSRRRSVSSTTSSSSSSNNSNTQPPPHPSTVPPTPPTKIESDVARVTSIETEASPEGASTSQYEVPPPLPPRENNPKRIFDASDGGGGISGGNSSSSANGARSKPEITPHRAHNRPEGASATGAPSASGGMARNSNSRSSSKAASGGPRRTAKMMNKITTGESPGDRPPLRANGELPTSKNTKGCISTLQI